MPIDEQTIAELRALRKQWSTAHERDLERLSDTFIPAVLKALPALLTAASNEAIVTAERDFWRSETQRETEKSQGLQRLYDAQQDLIEDQARKLHAAQREVEALRDRMSDEEILECAKIVGARQAKACDRGAGYSYQAGFQAGAIYALQQVTPPAASEEDAS